MDVVFFVKLLDSPNESFGQAGFEVLDFYNSHDRRGIDECYRYVRNELKDFSLHVCRLDPDEAGRYIMTDNQLLFARLKYRSVIHTRGRKIREQLELDYFIKTGKLL